ncbi:hypothetical protein [Micromonospora sp. SH-82]|uniref:hypothetical protein n=1 Tax=Micromonospora sp. SH-82 TaxID=3132938 RepID=UPI003EBED422
MPSDDDHDDRPHSSRRVSRGSTPTPGGPSTDDRQSGRGASVEDLRGRTGSDTVSEAGIGSGRASVDDRALEEARRTDQAEAGRGESYWAPVRAFAGELGRVCKEADVNSWLLYMGGLVLETDARKDLGLGLSDTKTKLLIGAAIVVATDAKNEIIPPAVEQWKRYRRNEPVEWGKLATGTVSAAAYLTPLWPLKDTVSAIRTDNPDPATIQLELDKLSKVYSSGSVAAGVHTAAFALHLRERMPNTTADGGPGFPSRVWQAARTCAKTPEARKFLFYKVGEWLNTAGRVTGNSRLIIAGNTVQLGHDMGSMAWKRIQEGGPKTAYVATGTAMATLGTFLGSVGKTWGSVDENNPDRVHVTAGGDSVRSAAWLTGAAAAFALATAAVNARRHWGSTGQAPQLEASQSRDGTELRPVTPAPVATSAVAQLQSPVAGRSDRDLSPASRQVPSGGTSVEGRTSSEGRRSTSSAVPVPGTVPPPRAGRRSGSPQ